MPLHENIDLPITEVFECIRYCNGTTLDFERRLRVRQACRYIDQSFDIERSSEYEAGRCYRKGSITYVRKDGQPITQDDLDALKLMDYGQVNIIEGKVGDPSVTHRYECDSSD